jgi:hypothetical protein
MYQYLALKNKGKPRIGKQAFASVTLQIDGYAIPAAFHPVFLVHGPQPNRLEFFLG